VTTYPVLPPQAVPGASLAVPIGEVEQVLI
jgi:hypothetical protein